jgi:hypothetical protein
MPNLTRADLLEAAKAFCDAFAKKKSVDEILSHFAFPSTTSATGDGSNNKNDDERGSDSENEILVHEHGLPELAPFLGRDFRGSKGAREYFEAMGSCLSYEDMQFVEFVVDSGEEGGRGKVAVRGQARFTWTETGQSWDETFVYILCFDSRAKLTWYEVWADSGAAYLARKGELVKGGVVKG